MDKPGPEFEIEIDHLSQLSQLQLSRDPSPTDMTFPIGHSDSSDIKQWITDHLPSIHTAIKNCVHGGSRESKINYANAFMAFIESCGMYLRDWDLVMDAVELYNKHQRDDAVAKLKASVRAIEDLAKDMGLEFQMLCELSSSGWIWNGPFCGAFYSQNAQHPFVGIAFRGSSNIKDWLTDARFKVVKASQGILHATKVSKGVYESMFGYRPGGSAFELIRKELGRLIPMIPNETGKDIITHVTGHSLGGSYSSLCYVQFTESDGPPAGAKLGDLYTFGSPRVGEADFVRALERDTKRQGRSWRIVNKGDAITKIPIPFIFFGWFKHLNAGIKISKDEAPAVIPNEVDAVGTVQSDPVVETPEDVDVRIDWLPKSIKEHLVTSYYNAMAKALSN